MTKFALWLQAAAAAVAVAAAGRQNDLAGEIDQLNNQSLLWGPYKPNLYFGVRPRVPHGLWTGLMWSKVDDYTDARDGFRYTCEQGDSMHGYGWDEYDARTGGIQTFHDEKNMIDITTSFVKIPGGKHGGSWAARIKGELRDDAPPDAKFMLLYYIAQEGTGELTPEGQGTKFGYEGDVTFKGRSDSLSDYTLLVTKGQGEHPTSDHVLSSTRKGDTTLVRSEVLAEENMWQGQQVVFSQLQEAVSYIQKNLPADSLPPAWQVYRVDHKPAQGNVHVVEKTFQGSFEFDVVFTSGSAEAQITAADISKALEAQSAAFNKRFSQVFDLQAPFTSKKYKDFGKAMFSNLLGGIGYFSGHQLIDRSYASEYDEDSDTFWEEAAEARERKAEQLEGPYELFTSVPSRPFFPRGFLWDEGFHLVPIADYDLDVALEIVRSWYKTMDEDGWIPREQILGPEARSRVPREFQVQYPHYANPPTLFLIIEGFMKRFRLAQQGESKSPDHTLHDAHIDNPELGEQYIRQMYPLLRRQYDWFRKTQRGDIKSYDREAFSTKEAYRWKGRTQTHVLPSGLDDYPRPDPPHPGELHVDLMAWVGLMTKSLKNIADYLGLEDDVAELGRNLAAIEHNLDDLHWSKEQGCYCDATIDDYEEHVLVCHKGYVSLAPFFLGLMKLDDPKMGKTLDLVGDKDLIFSPHGIRSLSKQDPQYETGENYWRSPVWMPMNYLILTELHHVATQKGPYQSKARDLYRRLRNNLVDTVYKSWEETGFAWEQYHPETGAGQRTQHFTGWTSLVVKIMAMDDLADVASKDEL